MIILGIDPGSHNTGYALIERLPDGGRLRVLEYGVLRAKTTASVYHRLGEICQSLEQILESYKPELLCLEDCFVHINVKSALVLGQARGAILATCHRHHLAIKEFLPTAVKYAVTGGGRSSKEAVAQAMQRHLALKEIPKLFDATDALALAWIGAKESELALQMPQYFSSNPKSKSRKSQSQLWLEKLSQTNSKA